MRIEPSAPSRLVEADGAPIRGSAAVPVRCRAWSESRPARAADEDESAALRHSWASITTDAALTVEVDEDAAPLTDARVVAAVTAVLHAAAARAEHALVVEVRDDGTVRVHDDGGPPERLLGVLTTTARDALRALGADLEVTASERLDGAVATILRPPPT